MFLDWQFTAQDDEYLEPARCHYREAFILIDAMYRDEPVMWCPYIYVDNDAALACGSQFGASLSAHGRRLAEACVTLSTHRSKTDCFSSGVLRFCCGGASRRLAAGYQDKPAVNELAMSITDNLTVAGAWIGKGELNFTETNGEDSTRSRREESSPGFVTHFLTRLAI
jgi:hypothetical protein